MEDRFRLVSLDSVALLDDAQKEMYLLGISSFACDRSPHHVDFLQNKAFSQSLHNASKTYLVVDLEHVSANSEILVAGYFSLGVNSYSLDYDDLSKRKQKMISDYTYPRDGHAGCYVLGELARNDAVSSKDLTGEFLLNSSLSIVRRAQSIIGGRLLLVDSRRSVFEQLYEPAGFRELALVGSTTEDGEKLITSFLAI